MKNSTALPVFRILFVICFILGLTQSIQAQDADFVATPSSVSVNPNDSFSVIVRVEINDGGIDGAEVHLNFDNSLLQINSVDRLSAAQLPTEIVGPLTFSQANGTIDYVAGALGGSNVNASFDFIQLNFTAITVGDSDLTFIDAFPRKSRITSGGVNILGEAIGIPIEVIPANADPVASFVATPTSGTAELLVKVDASNSTDDGNIVSYNWNFGDGNTSTGITASNNYLNQGDYTITLTVTDDEGAMNSTTESIEVNEAMITSYSITASAGPNGTIDPLTATVAEGGNQIFTIIPNPGYEVADVIVDDESVGVASTYEFVNVQANSTISAVFSLIPQTEPVITLDATAVVAEGGTLSIPLSISDADGDVLTVSYASVSTEPQLLQTANSGKETDPYPIDAEEFLTITNITTSPGNYSSSLDLSPVFGDGGGADNDGNGTYTITVTVDDEDGNSISQDVALTVNDVAQVISGTDVTRIEAESFDNQGPANTGGGNVGIGVEIDPLGFVNIGYSHVGDFVAYQVDVQTAGLYAFKMLVSDLGASGVPTSKTMDISSGTGSATTFTMVGTGNYANYVVQTINVNLEAGPQTLRFDWTGGNGFLFNMDYFDVEFLSAPDSPPTIAAISDVEIAEGGTVSVNIQVDDDINTDPTAAIVIYDKSVPAGTNNPFTPAAVVPEADYVLTSNGGGSYTLTWITDSTDGRSYEARVMASDGVNADVESRFTIDVAQIITEVIPARTFSAPLPWYGGNPLAPFTVAIENTNAQNLGWVNQGEFVEYLIDVPVAGAYDLEFFVGKGDAGPLTITVSEESGIGFDVLGTVDANIGNWQVYASETTQVTFTNSGIQTLRLDFSGAGGVNIRDFNFTPAGNFAPEIVIDAAASVAEGSTLNVPLSITDAEGDALTVTITSVSTEPNTLQSQQGGGGAQNGVEPYPFDASAFLSETITTNIPGEYTSTLTFTPTFGNGGSNGDGNGVYNISVEAADAEGNTITKQLALTVNDTDQVIAEVGTTQMEAESYDNQGNTGGGDGIGVETDGTGFVVGFTGTNDFLEYQIDVETAGSYQLDLVLGVPGADGTATTKTMNIFSNGNPIGTFVAEGTGGYGAFKTQSVLVNLDAGVQTLRFDFASPQYMFNIDYFSFTFQGAPDLPPTIAAIADVEITEGGTITSDIQVDDDGDIDPIVSIVIYDKSEPGGTNNPFTPSVAVADTKYTFATAGAGLYTLTWATDATDGRSYEARVIANDGVNSPVESRFDINIAQNIDELILARTFNNPLPWYGANPVAPFTVAIESGGNIGYNNPGDFTEYLIDVPNAGAYELRLKASKGDNEGGNPATLTISENNNGSFSPIGTLAIVTGGWLNPDDYRTEVSFSNSGVQTLRLDFGGSMNIFDFEFTEIPNTLPVVTITSPTTNGTPIEIARRTPITFEASVTDEEDDDAGLTAGLNWSINPFEPNFAGTGGSFTDELFIPGDYTITATSFDSDGESGTDEITVTILGPVVTFTTPIEDAVLNSTEVSLVWESQNMFLEAPANEHFHIYVNDNANRISTADFPEQESWNLTAADGVVEGPNSIRIVAAESGHEEFLNPEATDTITFTVCTTEITNIASTDPTTCDGGDGTINIVATGTNLEYSIDNGDNFNSNGSFTDLAAGTYDIIVRQMGSSNCEATDIVILQDPVGPTPIISGNLTYLEGSGGTILDAGAGFASYLWSPGDETTQTITALAGTYSVTVTDANGCEGTSIGVIVTQDDDDTPPMAICQNVTVQLDANGNGSITAAEIDNGSNDVSGIGSLAINIESFTCADLGDNTVMLTVTDNNGNVSTCNATVTVVDEVDPVITCPTNVSMVTSGPQVLSISPATATDNCDNAILTSFVRLDDASLGLDSPFQIGQTIIQWTAMDASGNMATCMQTITLTMAQSMSNDIVAFSVPSQVDNEMIDGTAKTVNLTVEIGTDVSVLAPTIQVSSLASVSPNTGVAQDFSNPVTYTVTAEDGTQQQWVVTVMVEEDTTAPTLVSLNPADDAGDINETPMPTATFSEPVQWASGGVITITDLDDMTTFGTLSEVSGGPISFIGNTIVIDPMQPFTAGHEYGIEIPNTALEDAAGNPFAGIPANGWTFTIFEDTTPPEISCPINIIVNNDAGECGAVVTYSVTSNGNLTMTAGLASGELFPIGTTTVSYQATGDNGITSNCSFDVVVTDNEDPTISCVSDITVQAAMGTSFMNVNYLAPTFGDNCPGATIVQTAGLTSGSEFPSGTTTNTFEVTDASGNTMSCSFDVTVESGTIGDTQLTVLDARTDTPLFDLVDGLVIQKSEIGEIPLGVIFNTDFNPNGVFFTLTGPLNERRSEGPAPHSLFGDIGINIQGKPFPVGDYTLVADPASGPTITVNFSVVDVIPVCENFNAVVGNTSNVSECGGTNGAITINVSNAALPVTYNWSHDGNLNANMATNLSAGSYTVTVTDDNGCSKTLIAVISDPAKPAVSLSTFTNVLDTDSAFTLSGGSPTGGSYSGTGVSNGMFDPAIGSGTYAITYSYTSPTTGCMASATRTIRVVSTAVGSSELIVLDATTDTPLFDLVDGLVIQKSEIGETPLGVIFNTDFNPNGVFFALTGPINERRSEGPAPHSLFGDIGINIQGKPFPVGEYTLVANPASGPTITVNFSVVDTDPLCDDMLVELQSKTNPTTCNGTNGSIVISVSGATGPLNYSWSHNGTLQSSTASGLSAGTYTVTVTDANGCSDMIATTLNDPAKPNVTLANLAPVMDTDAPVNLSGGLPTGGTYSGVGVTNGVFDPSIGAGNYLITYSFTDAVTGCDGSASRIIQVNTDAVSLAVLNFTLVNADTDEDLFELLDGMEINIDDLPTMNLDIRANTTTDVQSLRFTLSGNQSRGWTENTAPYALFGNIGPDYIGNEFAAGVYSVLATPYSLNGLSGITGTSLSVDFEFVSNATTLSSKRVSEMTISPNPADREATIVFAKPIEVKIAFVYDAMGRLVKTYKEGTKGKVLSMQLAVQDMPTGIYFVRTVDTDGGERQQAMAIKR